MVADIDYRTLTERQLAEHLAASVAALEDKHTTDSRPGSSCYQAARSTDVGIQGNPLRAHHS